MNPPPQESGKPTTDSNARDHGRARRDATVTAPPLYVDLDGALLRNSLFAESIAALLARFPLDVLRLPLWLLRGRDFAGKMIASRVDPDFTTLPYDDAFLEFLRQEKGRGRRVVLISESPRRHVEQVASHLGVFDEAISVAERSGPAEKRKLDTILEREASGEFDYVASTPADAPPGSACGRGIAVDPQPGARSAAGEAVRVEREFGGRRASFEATAKALRLHQWTKNILVFVPLLTAHRLHDIRLSLDALLAFLAFSFCASAIYLCNDVLDLTADRTHPRKRRRPLASGDVPLTRAALLVPSLLTAGAGVTLLLPIDFATYLTTYLIWSTLYSCALKRVVLLDVFVLAGFYTLRVIAGAAAIGVNLSFWLLAFSIFIFLSLALIKRVSELRELAAGDDAGRNRRGYESGDIDVISSLGSASGYLSVLVLALYINSRDVTILYREPNVLWLLCPLLLYWISRMWLLARRGKLHEDPLVFALEDRGSWVIAALAALVIALAV